MSCRHATQMISRSLERQLPFFTRVTLRAHLLICAPCRRYRRQVLLVRRVVRSLGDRLDTIWETPVSRLSSDARSRIRQALHHAGDDFLDNLAVDP